jgi:predicted lipid-binding transport protein (Tim44 family)
VVVGLLVVLIWAAVLAPPAVGAHTARREAFLGSFAGEAHPRLPSSQRIRCRRRIAGGFLVAMAATLLVGLLPTFRVFLAVHLFMVDSFLAYIALLAHMAARAASSEPAAAPEVVTGAASRPATPRRRLAIVRPALLGELGPVAEAG